MNNQDQRDSINATVGPGHWLLAIDTSSEQLGIAMTDGVDITELSLPGGRQQTTSLLPLIDFLGARAGLHQSDFGAVAVATGPGSFTGLRVGLSLAKGMALAQQSAVIGIPTLDVVARPYRSTRQAVVATLPAGRSRIVWCRVSDAGVLGPAVNCGLDEFLDEIGCLPDQLIVGELSAAAEALLLERGVRVETRLLGGRRAAALAELGFERWQLGQISDAESLEPIYLHGKQTSLPPRSQR
ncbi:MAG: tRNA (adenosine(37)-N6)-threonylcarbamoyltransferase complex dimerization subunit type 1 TsaB [Thermomicrobiales bacterium]